MRRKFSSFANFLSASSLDTKFYLPVSLKYLTAQNLIRCFYVIIFFLAIKNLEDWEFYLAKTEIDPLWVISWLRLAELKIGITAILWLNLCGGILAVVIPQYRISRFIIFLSLLEFYGLRYSFGKIGHGSHLAILISFLLIFLPKGWHLITQASRFVKSSVLMIFSACQAMIMLTYTMSAIGKFLYSFVQAYRGEVHALMPKGLALTVADRLLQTETNSYLGGWIIEHHYIGWLLMLGALYIQFFALWAAFRPSLHQVWGLALIGFHISVYLTMTITFEQNCLWLVLFFVYSPFRPKKFNILKFLHDLPLFGLLIQKIIKKYSFTVP